MLAVFLLGTFRVGAQAADPAAPAPPPSPVADPSAPAVVPVAAVALPLPPRERPADLARKAIPVKANKAAVDRKKKVAN